MTVAVRDFVAGMDIKTLNDALNGNKSGVVLAFNSAREAQFAMGNTQQIYISDESAQAIRTLVAEYSTRQEALLAANPPMAQVVAPVESSGCSKALVAAVSLAVLALGVFAASQRV